MPTLPVTHVATTDLTDMMNPEPGSRMDLPGFDDQFVDFPHYIIRITDQIWHDRDVELCLRYYSEDCAIHTLAGDISGAQTVVDNTYATMKSFPDRRLEADNVIWSDDGNGVFYSSHLITSKMTNLGDSEFGPATGKPVRILTIADCVCEQNKITEEWLVRDNAGLVKQLGLDIDHVAKKQAEADQDNAFSLPAFHSEQIAELETAPLLDPNMQPALDTKAADIGIKALDTIWNQRNLSNLEDLYDFRVRAQMPSNQDLYGHDQLAAFHGDLHASFTNTRLHIQHIADIPYLGDTRDVALRWAVRADHSGNGIYGTATHKPVLIMGVSQFRVMNGRIREEWSVWDDIAVRRQIETHRITA